MNYIFRTILVASLLAISLSGFSQGKYYEIVIEKGTYGNYGMVKPLSNQYDVKLSYDGKKQRQLLEGILEYLKNRPTLKIDTVLNGGTVVVYRDFATIGNKQTCFADLTGLIYMFAVPEEGYISIRAGGNSKIYASVFDAKLRISPGDDVVSEQDVPFNEFKFIQPTDGRTQSAVSPHGGLLGQATSRKINYKLAYPDSIFDPEGKIVNPNNKKIIEAFYDGYIADLDQFLKAKFKMK
ncbi:hypothetical protein [Chitinophaga sp.]|uniref:hypothetical protein n=1 Tax=Chitinophaga sp. TaxID=1869181 RepID=UPI002C6864E4|nr:hypothetical protein [Chitinophaga sp.]HWV67304.1 hypothetical protein [Chitinophaga sp.]